MEMQVIRSSVAKAARTYPVNQNSAAGPGWRRPLIASFMAAIAVVMVGWVVLLGALAFRLLANVVHALTG
jgi:hypothetical protein